jgi:DNA recombination protein RmuC
MLLMNEVMSWVILVLIAVVVGFYMIGARLLRMDVRAESELRKLENISDQQAQSREAQLKGLAEMHARLERRFGDMQQGIEKRLGEMSQSSIERLAKSNQQIQETLHKRLSEISGQVETRLNKGFEKTNETFIDVVKRLALIDEAQKKITELSSSVVSLQEVLNDKRSRGAFGEAQMMLQVRNALPENCFEEQYKLSNGTRVDCMLFLPEPTGNLPVDAKFPLDSYKTMMNPDAAQSDRVSAERQFKQDIKKHINDIAEKYIIPGETSDGALMFLPAEAVFAEIHAHQPDLVEEAQRRRVWMVSPTTMMAVLTTARAVLKDSATRKQVHLIQEHLIKLATDFDRFRKRMDNLSKHIQQANKDVEEVNTSARKISSRFEKIEKVELEDEEDIEMLEK